MKKCLCCLIVFADDDIPTCPFDGEASWGEPSGEDLARIDPPTSADEADADAPKKRSRK